MEKYHNSTIECKKIRPHVQELVHRCGSAELAGEYSLVGKSTIRRIMNDVHCTVQQATARKLLLALDHKRIEDRKNHTVHENLLKARQEQAKIESHQERLLGY